MAFININIKNLFIGDAEASKALLGNEVVWEKVKATEPIYILRENDLYEAVYTQGGGYTLGEISDKYELIIQPDESYTDYIKLEKDDYIHITDYIPGGKTYCVSTLSDADATGGSHIGGYGEWRFFLYQTSYYDYYHGTITNRYLYFNNAGQQFNMRAPNDEIRSKRVYKFGYYANKLYVGWASSNHEPYSYDGSVYQSNSNPNYVAPGDFFFGADNAAFKIYATDIYDNGTLVKRLRPISDGDGTPCLMDTLSGNLYYTQNGKTTDYLTSHGTYIKRVDVERYYTVSSDEVLKDAHGVWREKLVPNDDSEPLYGNECEITYGSPFVKDGGLYVEKIANGIATGEYVEKPTEKLLLWEDSILHEILFSEEYGYAKVGVSSEVNYEISEASTDYSDYVQINSSGIIPLDYTPNINTFVVLCTANHAPYSGYFELRGNGSECSYWMYYGGSNYHYYDFFHFGNKQYQFDYTSSQSTSNRKRWIKWGVYSGTMRVGNSSSSPSPTSFDGQISNPSPTKPEDFTGTSPLQIGSIPSFRFHALDIYENDVLVRKIRPIKLADGSISLIDFLSNKIYDANGAISSSNLSVSAGFMAQPSADKYYVKGGEVEVDGVKYEKLVANDGSEILSKISSISTSE